MGNALDRYRDAAQSYERLLIKVESPPYGELFEVRKKIGDVLVRRNDYQEALQAYQAASIFAVEAAATQRVVDWQIKLSNAVEQAGDGLRAGIALLSNSRMVIIRRHLRFSMPRQSTSRITMICNQKGRL